MKSILPHNRNGLINLTDLDLRTRRYVSILVQEKMRDRQDKCISVLEVIEKYMRISPNDTERISRVIVLCNGKGIKDILGLWVIYSHM